MDLSREERLISRVIDGTAGSADWVELELLAGDDPSVWRDLAGALRTESELRVAVEDRLGFADGVELPQSVGARSTAAGAFPGLGSSGLGWAAAVLVGVLWAVFEFTGGSGPTAPEVVDGAPTPGPNTEDVRLAYVDTGMREGWLVGELPRVLVRATPDPQSQSVEVLYLRRTIERATVDEFYRTAQDEHGRSVATPVHFQDLQLGGGKSL